MLKIAICESDAVSAAKVTAYLDRYKAERGVEMTYALHEGAAAFPENVEEKTDVAFIELEKPDLIGLETAHRLHETDPETAIIFVTKMKQFVLQGNVVDVMDILAKPISYSAFATIMDRVIKRKAKFAPALYLQTKEGNAVRLECNDIYYLEVVGGKTIYRTKEGDIEVAGSLAEEKQRLPESVFARCNAKTVVHLGYVTKVMGNNVFAGGKTFSVSVNHRSEFLGRLLAFMDRR